MQGVASYVFSMELFPLPGFNPILELELHHETFNRSVRWIDENCGKDY